MEKLNASMADSKTRVWYCCGLCNDDFLLNLAPDANTGNGWLTDLTDDLSVPLPPEGLSVFKTINPTCGVT